MEQARIVRRRRATLGTGSGAHFVHDGFSDSLYVLFPVWAEALGLSHAQVGILKMVFSGAMAAFQVPAGFLAERWGERILLATGTAVAGQTTQDELFRDLYRDGRRRLTPFAVPRIMASSGASRVSMELGIEGPGMTLSTACSSSSHAIGVAFWMVSRGASQVALTGGSEAPFSLGHLKAWDSMRVIAPDLCRPFSRDRKGLILAEGAGALVLEELETARARGARIHAEIKGFGLSSDGSHITKPSERGASRALEAALRDASMTPESVDYVNAHGTGTPLNDATETRAVKTVFGEHASQLLISSTKSMHGHALGAGGALECAATALALENGVIPPTAGYLGPDPDCDLDVVPNEAREQPIRRALSSSFAFGGLNAVLALERWNGD